MSLWFHLQKQSVGRLNNFTPPNEISITSMAAFLGFIIMDDLLTRNDHTIGGSKRLIHTKFFILTMSWIVGKNVLMVVCYTSRMNYGVMF